MLVLHVILAQRFSAARHSGLSFWGGAALQRCDNRIVLNLALATEVTPSTRERVFPKPARPSVEGLAPRARRERLFVRTFQSGFLLLLRKIPHLQNQIRNLKWLR